jgi:beta-glucosidase
MKKLLILVVVLFVSSCVQPTTPEIIPINPCEDPNSYACFIEPSCDIYEGTCDELAQKMLDTLTLEEKVGQMIQAERGYISSDEVKEYNIGSILSGGGSHPNDLYDDHQAWYDMVTDFQEAALSSSSGIPLLYGVDAVHGHNNVYDMTIFPHQINMGVIDDPDLTYALSKATSEQLLTTGIRWNFAPSLSVNQHIGWGRSYESYGEHPELFESLTMPAILGYLEHGIIPTAKHFLADGGTMGIDQGNAIIDEINLDVHLTPYLEAIQAKVPTIMASYSSINGIKMHGHTYYLQELLKDDLGFEGFIISDWNAIHQLEGSFYQQIVTSVNAGIDMLMEPYDWKSAYQELLFAIGNGDISLERINDAVFRILRVKFQSNLMSQPTFKLDYTNDMKLDHTLLARELAIKSAVLLKNNDALPLSTTQNIYLSGPASDHIGLMSGGWTTNWQGNPDNIFNVGTSLKEGLEQEITLSSYEASDVVIVALAEMPYAEGIGDQGYPSLVTGNAHPDNIHALNQAMQAKNEGKRVIGILFSGRPLFLDQYLDYFDGFISAFLPGSEGGYALTQLIFGYQHFSGRLSYSWPKDASTWGVTSWQETYDPTRFLFPYQFGLNYSS